MDHDVLETARRYRESRQGLPRVERMNEATGAPTRSALTPSEARKESVDGMSVEIIQGASQKPAASDVLVECFRSAEEQLSGRLFVGFPTFGTSSEPYQVDALWMSEAKGLVVFDLVEGDDPGDFQSRQDESYNRIESRLKDDSRLVHRRTLRIPIHTISFAPSPNGAGSDEGEYRIADSSSLFDTLHSLDWQQSDRELYEIALSAVENVSTIRRSRTRRKLGREGSRGSILGRLEKSIATLDHRQSRAVIETARGVQRIRGLAGSGKTIVLALKAAYLHAQQPEWRIGVTFNTRSLKGTFERLIRDFHIQQTRMEPDWSCLHVINAWGGRGESGIYSEFCRAHGIDYLDFSAAKAKFGSAGAFAGACQQALTQVASGRSVYDALLIDEAQDMPPAFLRLCHRFLRGSEHLVYAYDELQNLSGESLPPPEDIFGETPRGEPSVQFDLGGAQQPQRDIVLHRCYRNSRPILTTAHALGFGIYRRPPRSVPPPLPDLPRVPTPRTGLVQMFDHTTLWEEVGYRAKDGILASATDVTLSRTPETSPLFLEEHSPRDDLVQFHVFRNQQEQAEWLAREIGKNLKYDELHHDDIMVINPNPLSTRKNVGLARRLLWDMGIQSHLAGVDTDRDVFFEESEHSVTFTGVHRAKGNEAAMVYVVNAQEGLAGQFNLARIRNRLFTAITRSKAWVRVSGIGSQMGELKQEYERLVAHDFELRFRYPSAEEREHLRIIHRDMTQAERDRVSRGNQNLAAMIEGLERGELRPEDLDQDTVAKFVRMLGRRQ